MGSALQFENSNDIANFKQVLQQGNHATSTEAGFNAVNQSLIDYLATRYQGELQGYPITPAQLDGLMEQGSPSPQLQREPDAAVTQRVNRSSPTNIESGVGLYQ